MTSAATLWLAFKTDRLDFYVVPQICESRAELSAGSIRRGMGGPCPSAKAFHLVPGAPDGAVASTRVACLSGVIQIWHILLLNVFQGVVKRFRRHCPSGDGARLCREKGDLAPAIALNSSNFNLGRFARPSPRRLVLAAVGPGYASPSMASVT